MPLRRALAALATLVFVPHPAEAAPYEVFVDVATEDELYELLLTEQISRASFDALLLLHQSRVDINRANRDELYLLPNLEYDDVDRILEYRERAGWIHQLADLVASGALPRRLTDPLASFVVVRSREPTHEPPRGFARFQGRWSGRYDRLPPAMAVQARVLAAAHLDAGVVATLTRNSLRRVRWDASRDGFSVEPESPRLEVPKAYLEWDTGAWGIVVGTYRIGFAQRLTFDITGQVTPNGAFGDYELRRGTGLTLRCKRGAGELGSSPCPRAPVARVTPDFGWTNRLTGIAAGFRDLRLKRGDSSGYLWVSFQPHRARSSELVRSSRCADPRNDDDPGCRAPLVYVRDREPTAPSSTATYASLPRIAAEGLIGAHYGYSWSSQGRVALTGYGAITRWLVEGVQLDYQETARRPFGRRFGAIGLSASRGFGRQDLFVELTRSFDRQPGGGGGYGVIARGVTSFSRGEIDISARYYDPRFSNPYARPISAPDELDGIRARDETGLRVRLVRRPFPRVAFRGLLDGWRRISVGSLHASSFARLDVDLGSSSVWSVWAEYRTVGRLALLASRVALNPTQRLAMSCQLQHRWSRSVSVRRQHDLAAVLQLAANPLEMFRLRTRLRYDVEDIDDNRRLPHTIWLYVDASLTVRQRDTVRARYDLRTFLDERDSTRARAPNPEHWLWLEYVLRY